MADVKNAEELHRRLTAISERIVRAHTANEGDKGAGEQEQVAKELAGAKSEIENILVELSEVRHGGKSE
jgi:hypothetical protein